MSDQSFPAANDESLDTTLDVPADEVVDTPVDESSLQDVDPDASGDAAQQEVRLSDDESDDLPASPPEERPIAGEFLDNGDAGPQETIEQRIAQEEPDPNSAYGAPVDESGMDAERRDRVGGDDPDAIPAPEDVLGDLH